MRLLPLALLALLMAGCAAPVAVQNPRTGQTVLCKRPASEWNPWSQADACVAGYLAQGWTIVR